MENPGRNFNEIEQGFLKLHESDNASLIEWYNLNRESIQFLSDLTDEKKEKLARILASIAVSFFELNEQKTGLSLAKKANNIYKGLLRRGLQIEDKLFFRIALWNIGQYHYKRQNYFNSFRYFKKAHSIDQNNYELLNDLLKETKFKLLMRIAKYLMGLGIITLVFKYILVFQNSQSQYLVIIGYGGALLLILSGIIFWFNKKPKLKTQT